MRWHIPGSSMSLPRAWNSFYVIPCKACKHQTVLGRARAVPEKAPRQTHFSVTTKLIDLGDGSNALCYSDAKLGQS